MFQIKAIWGKLCIEHQLFSFCCFVQTSSPGGETGASPQPITSKCSSHLLLSEEVSYRLLRGWPTMESIVQRFDQDATDWCGTRGALPAAEPQSWRSSMGKGSAPGLCLLHGSHYCNKTWWIIRLLVLQGFASQHALLLGPGLCSSSCNFQCCCFLNNATEP